MEGWFGLAVVLFWVGLVLDLVGLGLCWFDWVVSDHDGNKRARPLAVKFLIETVEQMVKDAGKACIMSISRSNSLLKIHKKLGWSVDDKPSHEMIKMII